MAYRNVNLSRSPELNPSLKLNWAKKHLDTLNVAVGEFLNGKTHTVRTEDDFEAGQYIIYLHPSPIRAELGLIAGDALCCLRASLDHLACALTLTLNGIRNDGASFPIIPLNNTKGRKLFKDSVIGVPKDARTIIELLQPYHHGDTYKATKLWKLHRLWNIDKHRRIPLHGIFAQVPVRFPADMPPISGGSDDTGVMRFPLAAKPYVELNPTVEINVYFGDETEGIIVSVQELIGIYNFVRYEVFPHFKQFFQSPEVLG